MIQIGSWTVHAFYAREAARFPGRITAVSVACSVSRTSNLRVRPTFFESHFAHCIPPSYTSSLQCSLFRFALFLASIAAVCEWPLSNPTTPLCVLSRNVLSRYSNLSDLGICAPGVFGAVWDWFPTQPVRKYFPYAHTNPIDWSIDWWIGLLIDLLIVWLIDWRNVALRICIIADTGRSFFLSASALCYSSRHFAMGSFASGWCRPVEWKKYPSVTKCMHKILHITLYILQALNFFPMLFFRFFLWFCRWILPNCTLLSSEGYTGRRNSSTLRYPAGAYRTGNGIVGSSSLNYSGFFSFIFQ